MGDASRIVVEVAGDSDSLVKAAGVAADALTDLADKASKAAADMAASSDKTIDANKEIGGSFEGVARAATSMADDVYASVEKAIEAARRQGEAALASGDDYKAASDVIKESEASIVTAIEGAAASVAAAHDRMAESAERAAEETSASADSMVKSSARVAESAAGAADEIAVSGDKVKVTAAETAEASSAAADKTVAANARAGSSATKSAAESEAAFGSSSSKLSKAGKLITEGLLGVAAGAVYMGVKFQETTTKFVTQAGAGVAQTKALSKGILDMAGEVGDTPDQLATAMYHVVSSMNAVLPPTHRVGDELAILKVAAQGAKVGGSDLEDTTYALASAMNALHEPASGATKVMGQLNAIVGSGDMTMTDLLGALKSGLIPEAQTFGISFRSVGAALAVMGDEGMRGAMAGTRLRMTLALLAAPTKMATSILEDLGLKSADATKQANTMTRTLEAAGVQTTQLAADLRKPDGLQVALHDLDTHLRNSGLSAEQTAAVISRAFGGGRSGATIALLAQNTDRIQKKYQQIGETVKAFPHDVGVTYSTMQVQFDQVEGEIASLGVRLGDDLIPKVHEGIVDLEDFAHWLEHNRVEAGLLAAAVTTFASIAVGSYLTSKLRGAVTLLREFGSLTGIVSKTAGIGGSVASSASTGAAGGAVSTLESKAGIVGVTGSPIEAGSVANPIAVAIKAGEYTPGLGSTGAKATAEGGLAEDAETATPAAAAAGLGTAEEATAGAGILATIKSGIGDAASGLLKAGLIAGVGDLVAHVTGDVIGGKTGSDVKTIGTDAAFGAAAGSFLGPGGTLAGGVTGALIGGFTTFVHSSAEEYGNQIADKITGGLRKDLGKPMDVNVITNLHATVEKAATAWKGAMNDATAQALSKLSLAQRVSAETGGKTPAPSAASLAAIQAQQFASGQQIGQALSKTMSAESEYFAGGSQAIPQVIDQIEKKLSQLPEAAREGASASLVAIVEEFQQDGRLPEGATDDLITALEQKWSGLAPYLQSAIGGAMSGVQTSIEQAAATATPVLNELTAGQAALDKAQGFIDTLHEKWDSIPADAKLTAGDAQNVFSSVMTDLQGIIATSTGKQKQSAVTAYQQMHDQSISYFTDMKTAINDQMTSIYSKMSVGGDISAAATDAIKANYRSMVAVLQAQLASGAIVTKSGMAKIKQEMTAALAGLGYKSIGAFVKSETATLTGSSTTGLGHGLGQISPATGSKAPLATTGPDASAINSAATALVTNAAGGTLMQLGRPGEAGRDAIPLNAGGHAIVAGAGEQVAVFTRHQQTVANRYLAGIGGLPGLFGNVTRPNYMASGGLLGAPSTTLGGDIGTAADTALESVTAAANELLIKAGVIGAGVIAGTGGGPSVGVGQLVPGIMAIEQRAAQIAGLPFVESIVAELLHRESSGGVNEPPSGSLNATGPNQVIPSTFRSFALPGYDNISNPLDNAIASFRYIKQRYGSLQAMAATVGLYGAGYVGYAGGGFAGGDPTASAASVPKVSAQTPKFVNTKKPPTAKGPSTHTVAVRKLSVGANLSKLALIPEFAGDAATLQSQMNLIGDSENNGLQGLIGALAGLPTSVSSGQGEAANRYFIEQGDMQYVTPVAQNLQALTSVLLGGASSTLPGAIVPGMTYQHAYSIYDQALEAYNTYAAANPDDPNAQIWDDNLGNLQSLLDYVGSDPMHRQITTADKSILDLFPVTANSNGAQIPFNQVGETIPVAERAADDLEASALNGVNKLSQQLNSKIGRVTGLYKHHEATTLALEKADHALYLGLEAQLDKLRITADQDVLGEAEKAYGVASKKYDLNQALTAVGNELSAERALPAPDQSYIDYLDSIKANLTEQTSDAQAINAVDEYAVIDTQKAGLESQLTGVTNQLSLLSASGSQDTASKLSLTSTEAALKAQLAVAAQQAAAGTAGATTQESALKQQLAVVTNKVSQLTIADAVTADQRKAQESTLTSTEAALKAKIAALGAPNTNAIVKAQIALAEQNLEQQATDVQRTLLTLGGSSTQVGTPSSGSSVYGTLYSRLAIMSDQVTTDQGYVSSATSDLATVMADVQAMNAEIATGFDASGLQTIPGSTAPDTTTLTDLIGQQQAIEVQANAIASSLAGTIAGIKPLIPAFEHGTLSVPRTGLALVHEGETIIPNPRGPYGSQFAQGGVVGGGPAHVSVVNQFHGSIEPLIGLIRSTVTHPTTIRQISEAVGYRGRTIGSAPGGWRRS